MAMITQTAVASQWGQVKAAAGVDFIVPKHMNDLDSVASLNHMLERAFSNPAQVSSG